MRKVIAVVVVSFTLLVFALRLYYLQIMSYDMDHILSDGSVERMPIYPERGYIYDRNGKLIVANEPSYDVLITPGNMKPFDTLGLCSLLKIKREDIEKIYRQARAYSHLKPSLLIGQLSPQEYAYFQEKLYSYEGFSLRRSLKRSYKINIAPNVLGYTGEVNNAEIKKDEYYKKGDYIGKQGIELQYEKFLRGSKGVRYLQKDRFNRKIGPFKNSIYDTLPKKGNDIQLTIDADFQSYAEKLMKNKRGSIVAIEPSSGEVLAAVSSPTYNPELLVGRYRSKNYTKLYNDSISKPLYDRSLLSQYAPGSTFKIINALIALQENVVLEEDLITCHYGFKYGRNAFMKCHCGSFHNNFQTAIVKSCNTYFAKIYLKLLTKNKNHHLLFDTWSNHVKSFGLGSFLGYDLPNGRPGKVPTSLTYDTVYGRNWHPKYTVSNAIGQGEILITPIQMANVAATIANRGYYYTPHFIKYIDGKTTDNTKFKVKNKTSISPKHFKSVVEAMEKVYWEGTAKWLRVKDIRIAGKTGTVENFINIDGKKAQLTDHSIFMAFAPVEDPKISIMVLVENGYHGSRYAGYIATLCIERYLKGYITRKDLEKKMLEKSLEREYEKPYSGKPFKTNEKKW